MIPHEVIKKNIEKFEENRSLVVCSTIKDEDENICPLTDIDATNKLHRDFFIDSQLSLLLSVKEMVESQMFEDSAQGGQFSMHTDGYNNALEDLQSLLDIEINKVKEI